jgi:hypothetical protein
MIIPKILPHNPQNRPLHFVAETAPSFDNLSQHLTVFARKVSQFLSQRF